MKNILRVLAALILAFQFQLLLPLSTPPIYASDTADVTVTATPGAIVPPTITNGVGATNVTDNDARLNGEITDAGNDNPTVWVYWDTADGGTNPAAWSNNFTLGVKPLGTLYHDLTDVLNPLTLYYYRYYAVNSAGSDWADSSANFTTSFVAPSGFVLTDLGAITINAAWTTAPGANYTMVRISRTTFPTSPTEGELFCYSDGTTANSTGYSLDVTEYFASAWSFLSDNVTYSADYATASIGGEGMTEIATAITAFGNIVAQVLPFLLVALVTALAFWSNRPSVPAGSRSIFLLLLAVPLDLVYGLSLSATNTVASAEWVGGIIIAVIGTFCLIKAVTDQIKGRAR